MKIWRTAFIILLAVNLLALIAFIFYVTIPAKDYISYEAEKRAFAEGNTLTVRTSKADFEGIANTYIQDAMKDQPIPLTLSVNDDVALSTELEVFSMTLPILLKFEPYVQDDGNLLLEQKSVNIGMLDIPPESALKLLRDSVTLPEFMEVDPGSEEILLRLSDIPLDDGISVRAEAFNLEEDDIRLRVTITQ
ncbi:YpmS family protein [Planomicrobium okeanokoites]|uniref:YpmS family protein n=1 Tax=Planomicrobium okeanokoites TaxID=244 RepID=UPI0024921E3F|nr:YpmS family protein [Planomicrobium okeanokoites]